MKFRSKFLRVAVEQSINKHVIKDFKEKLKQKILYIDELEEKIEKTQTEMEFTRNSYKNIKSRMFHKDNDYS